MASIEVVNQENKKVGTLQLNDEIFNAKVNVALVKQVIRGQLACRRQGTHKTKTKAEVRGTNKKPYKQKGTGNARRGSNRSPLITGGGVAHGPRPRSYETKTPKKMVNGALRCVLSDRLKAQRLIVVDEFKLKDHKTKTFFEIARKKMELKNALIVDESNQNLQRSAANIPLLRVLPTGGLNVYDVVRHDWLVLTKKAVEAIEARLAVKGEAPATSKKAGKSKE